MLNIIQNLALAPPTCLYSTTVPLTLEYGSIWIHCRKS